MSAAFLLRVSRSSASPWKLETFSQQEKLSSGLFSICLAVLIAHCCCLTDTFFCVCAFCFPFCLSLWSRWQQVHGITRNFKSKFPQRNIEKLKSELFFIQRGGGGGHPCCNRREKCRGRKLQMSKCATLKTSGNLISIVLSTFFHFGSVAQAKIAFGKCKNIVKTRSLCSEEKIQDWSRSRVS